MFPSHARRTPDNSQKLLTIPSNQFQPISNPLRPPPLVRPTPPPSPTSSSCSASSLVLFPRPPPSSSLSLPHPSSANLRTSCFVTGAFVDVLDTGGSYGGHGDVDGGGDGDGLLLPDFWLSLSDCAETNKNTNTNRIVPLSPPTKQNS